MKTNCWLILGTMIATTAVAQVNTNTLPVIPPPASAAPAAPPPAPVVAPAETQAKAPVKKAAGKAKKKAVKKARAAARTAEQKPADLLPVTLVAGPATVIADNVNLRGQAGLKGEVVGHVKKGDLVTVLAEINLDKPKAGEPAQWAKVALPAGSKVWIDSKFVDASNNVVAVKKLNLRGGPGENYSVLGVIEKGAGITAVTTKGDWTQIEPPASAFAFVAAGYLKQESPLIDTNVPVPPGLTTTEPVPPTPTPVAPPILAPPPALPPTPTTVTEAPPIAPPAPTPPPTPEVAAAVTPTVAVPAPPPPATPPATPPVTPALDVAPPTNSPDIDTNLPPPPPRIVTHEGTVRPSVSLVAPTYFELYDPATDKAVNYLYSTTTNLNLSRYNGLHITVTGEEGLDPRWQDTPVLAIQKIYVLSTDTPASGEPELKPVRNGRFGR